MKYQTNNELSHFSFRESFFHDIQVAQGFVLTLDNVHILPENTCNRDIRLMRCNEMELHILEPANLEVWEEGNRIYNADGKLMKQAEDRLISKEEYKEVFTMLLEQEIYDITQKGNQYEIIVQGEEHGYVIRVEGSEDLETWDRFLNINSF